jgi:hypothetical protein
MEAERGSPGWEVGGDWSCTTATQESMRGDVLALNDDSGAAKVRSATSADEGNDVGSLHGDGGACCGGSSAPC